MVISSFARKYLKGRFEMTEDLEEVNNQTSLNEILEVCNNKSVQEAALGVVVGEAYAHITFNAETIVWSKITPRIIPKPTPEQSKALSEYLAENNLGLA